MSAVAAELSRQAHGISLASSSSKESAEAKHKQMELELSDLSANLFSTNEMVATERQACTHAGESLVPTRAIVGTLKAQLETAEIELSR